MAESASSELLNTENNADEYHVGISGDKLAKSTCLRRATPLKLEISNDETESSEQMSFTVGQTF